MERPSVTALLLCYGLCMAAAEQCADSITTRRHSVGEVEVTAERVPGGVSGTHPEQTVTLRELEAQGIADVGEAAKRLAGVTVRDYGGVGGLKTVSVRSLSAHHTAVSYDGVVVQNTQAGQVDVGRYGTDNVAAITLSVGDGGDMLQSARHYASAAVLSITTRRPWESDTSRCGGRAGVAPGSWGTVSTAAHWWQRAGRRVVVSASGGYTRADGNYSYTLANVTQTVGGKRNNSDIAAWKAEGNAVVSLCKESALEAKVYWYRSRRGLPGSVIYYNPVSNERLWDEEFFAQTVYTAAATRRLSVQARAKYTHTWNRYRDTGAKYPGGENVETAVQTEWYGSATALWRPFDGVSIALAEDLALNALSTNINDNPRPRRFTSLTTVAARLMSQRLTVDADVTATYAHESVAAGERPPVRRRLSPSAGVSYRLSARHALYVRAMYKNTFRVATFNDLYYRDMGTPNLRPERAREYDVGVTWAAPASRRLTLCTVAADAFYNDVRDKIVAYPTLYVWKMANFGKVRITGVTLAAAADVALSRRIAVDARLSYMWQKAVDVSDRTSLYYKNDVPYTPRSSGSASLSLRTEWATVTWSAQGCGARYCLQQNTAEYRVAGYCEHSVTLARQMRLRRCVVGVRLTVQNITGKHYEVVKYYPMPGRAWTVAVSIAMD